MLDFDQTYFGCGNKVPANQLKKLLNEKDFSFLLPDSTSFKVDNGFIHSTIDTVFPFINDIETYAIATVSHCANDLIASGVAPIQASVSIGLSSGLDEKETKLLFVSIKRGLFDLGIHSSNYHTFRADQTSITVSVNGYSFSVKPKLKLEKKYHIYLTKPLGVWSTQLLNKNKNINSYIKQSNISKLAFVNSKFVKYATDISGFGLMGHLLPLLEEQNYCATLCLKSILKPIELSLQQTDHYLGCSARSNVESFSSFVENINELNELIMDVLFGGEINGPILAIVDHNDMLNIELQSLGELIHIGTIVPRSGNKRKPIMVEV